MLLLAYVIYCVALYYNLYLEAWANTWNLPFPPRNHGQVIECLFTIMTIMYHTKLQLYNSHFI